jgi:hypothetical protein
VWRLALFIAVGGALFLVGAVTANGHLSSGSHLATETTAATVISFRFSDKGHHGHEFTRTSGSGTLTLAEAPQQPRTTYPSTSATGTVTLRRWLLVGNRVIIEHNFNMDVTAGTYRFNQLVRGVILQGTVTKAAAVSKDLCSLGSTGSFGVSQGIAKGRPNFIGIEMCGFRLGLTNGLAGQRVAVTVKVAPTS